MNSKIYEELGISKEVYDFGQNILEGLKERFEKIDENAEYNQLKVLKDAKLVANRREGKTIYYRLSDDHVKTIIAQGFEHLLEEDQ